MNRSQRSQRSHRSTPAAASPFGRSTIRCLLHLSVNHNFTESLELTRKTPPKLLPTICSSINCPSPPNKLQLPTCFSISSAARPQHLHGRTPALPSKHPTKQPRHSSVPPHLQSTFSEEEDSVLAAVHLLPINPTSVCAPSPPSLSATESAESSHEAASTSCHVLGQLQLHRILQPRDLFPPIARSVIFSPTKTQAGLLLPKPISGVVDREATCAAAAKEQPTVWASNSSSFTAQQAQEKEQPISFSPRS